MDYLFVHVTANSRGLARQFMRLSSQVFNAVFWQFPSGFDVLEAEMHDVVFSLNRKTRENWFNPNFCHDADLEREAETMIMSLDEALTSKDEDTGEDVLEGECCKWLTDWKPEDRPMALYIIGLETWSLTAKKTFGIGTMAWHAADRKIRRMESLLEDDETWEYVVAYLAENHQARPIWMWRLINTMVLEWANELEDRRVVDSLREYNKRHPTPIQHGFVAEILQQSDGSLILNYRRASTSDESDIIYHQFGIS